VATRCGKCKACLNVKRLQDSIAHQAAQAYTQKGSVQSGTQSGPGKRFVHQVVPAQAFDDDAVVLWNVVLKDNPCETWQKIIIVTTLEVKLVQASSVVFNLWVGDYEHGYVKLVDDLWYPGRSSVKGFRTPEEAAMQYLRDCYYLPENS
jgi:hypothetical protein